MCIRTSFSRKQLYQSHYNMKVQPSQVLVFHWCVDYFGWYDNMSVVWVNGDNPVHRDIQYSLITVIMITYKHIIITPLTSWPPPGNFKVCYPNAFHRRSNTMQFYLGGIFFSFLLQDPMWIYIRIFWFCHDFFYNKNIISIFLIIIVSY